MGRSPESGLRTRGQKATWPDEQQQEARRGTNVGPKGPGAAGAVSGERFTCAVGIVTVQLRSPGGVSIGSRLQSEAESERPQD